MKNSIQCLPRIYGGYSNRKVILILKESINQIQTLNVSNGCKFYAEMFSIPKLSTHISNAQTLSPPKVAAQKQNPTKIKIQERTKNEGNGRQKSRDKDEWPQQQQQSHNTINNNMYSVTFKHIDSVKHVEQGILFFLYSLCLC